MKLAVIVVFLILWLPALPASAATGVSIATQSASPLDGDRILIITTNGQAGSELADLIAQLYEAKVSVKHPSEYSPKVDEYAYDGFIYYAADYYTEPKAGFIEDVETTAKPVLWINYHGWLLNKNALAANDVVILDEHNMTASGLRRGRRAVSMDPTDVTQVDAPYAEVLYWLTSEAGGQAPGAVRSDNFTYVSYLPSTDVFTEQFSFFLEAIRATFGLVVPPEAPKRPDFDKRVAAAEQDRFRTGIHLPVYVARSAEKVAGYDSDQWHENLLRIRRSGAEWVNIVRTYYQKDLHATRVYVDSDLTPTLSSLENIIRDAHDIGLLVRLHIAINLVEREPLHWHGMIKPSDRAAWWDSYSAHVVRMAEFAQDNAVESLVVGTEFTSMEPDANQWRRLVERVRTEARYTGMVGYGINYGAVKLKWANVLDFLSVSAYWPLAEDRDPELETLKASWKKLDKQLRALSKNRVAVPLEFGEVGYASQPYAAVLPFSWKSHRGRQQDMNEQLRAYQALYWFLKNAEYVSGVHFFASTQEDTQSDSIGYTPFGKPAERVMEQIINLR